MKILKRKILFCFTTSQDIFREKSEPNYYPYSFLYDRLLGFKSSSIRDSCQQLVGDGDLDKITRNNFTFFRLTGRGRDRLSSFFPSLPAQRKSGDASWKIAIINCSNQAKKAKAALRQLRLGLIKLGFKKLTRSVYLTPLPVSQRLKDFLLERNFSAEIAVIEAKKLVWGDDKQLANFLWSLNDLERGCQSLIRKVEALLAKIKNKKGLSQELKNQYSVLCDQYFTLLEADPGLPKSFLPASWPANLLRESFTRLSLALDTKKNQTDLV